MARSSWIDVGRTAKVKAVYGDTSMGREPFQAVLITLCLVVDGKECPLRFKLVDPVTAFNDGMGVDMVTMPSSTYERMRFIAETLSDQLKRAIKKMNKHGLVLGKPFSDQPKKGEQYGEYAETAGVAESQDCECGEDCGDCARVVGNRGDGTTGP